MLFRFVFSLLLIGWHTTPPRPNRIDFDYKWIICMFLFAIVLLLFLSLFSSSFSAFLYSSCPLLCIVFHVNVCSVNYARHIFLLITILLFSLQHSEQPTSIGKTRQQLNPIRQHSVTLKPPPPLKFPSTTEWWDSMWIAECYSNYGKCQGAPPYSSARMHFLLASRCTVVSRLPMGALLSPIWMKTPLKETEMFPLRQFQSHPGRSSNRLWASITRVHPPARQPKT